MEETNRSVCSSRFAVGRKRIVDKKQNNKLVRSWMFAIRQGWVALKNRIQILLTNTGRNYFFVLFKLVEISSFGKLGVDINVLLDSVCPELVKRARRISKQTTIVIVASLIMFLLAPFASLDSRLLGNDPTTLKLRGASKGWIAGANTAEAASVGELQSQLNGLNGQINALKGSVAQKANEKASLEGQIAIFNAQIAGLELQIQATSAEIEKTELEIGQTEQKIRETEAELEIQKEIIREHLRIIYEEGRVSAVEVVVSADDFSEFLNKSEYLHTTQQKVQETAEKIRQLKIELNEKKKALENKRSDLGNMRVELDARRADLAAQKAQKDAILEKTKGEEAAFQAQLNESRNAFASVQSQIDSVLSSVPAGGGSASYGNVKRGQQIGTQGNSGYSFGSHLHFGAYRGTQDIDPQPFLNNGTFSYPLANPTITQGYWGAFSHRGVGWPGGIDMTQYFGAPVRAAADGTIIFNGYNGATFGHYIIMDHGNGLRTLYAHMQ